MNAALALAEPFADDAEATPAPAPTLDPAIPGLLDRARQALRARHYARRTENAYVEWMYRFFAHFAGRAPAALGAADLAAFLAALDRNPETTAYMRKEARLALSLLFHAVLGQKLERPQGFGHVEGGQRLALSRAEIARLTGALDPTNGLIAALLYGSGLKLAEAVALRVRDIDLEAGVIHLRSERERRGNRWAILPDRVRAGLVRQLAAVRARHQADLAQGGGVVPVPDGVRLADPAAARSLEWQWLFPNPRVQRDPLSGLGRRAHLPEAVVQRAMVNAARDAGLAAPIDAHTLRHCFTVHLLAAGCDAELVKGLLGVAPLPARRADLPAGVRSPIDE